MTSRQLLRAAGLRRTEARKVVLEVLGDAGRPLSHKEVAGRPEAGRFDRVTLYRALTTLQEAGPGTASHAGGGHRDPGAAGLSDHHRQGADDRSHVRRGERARVHRLDAGFSRDARRGARDGGVIVGLIGLNPAIAEHLIDEFGPDHFRISDLFRDNIGRERFGVEVWDGARRTEELIESCDVVLVTGTTLQNGSFGAI